MKCCVSIDMDFFCRVLGEWGWHGCESDNFVMSDDFIMLWPLRGTEKELIEKTDPRVYADVEPQDFPGRLISYGFRFDNSTKVYVSWTHQQAYGIFKNAESNLIYNFDAHHDCGYPMNGGDGMQYIPGTMKSIPALNEGNWGMHLTKLHKKKIDVVYPAWRKLKDDSAISACKFKSDHFFNMRPQLRIVESIVISQSPCYVPPHFDKMMHKMVDNFIYYNCELKRDTSFNRVNVMEMVDARGGII